MLVNRKIEEARYFLNQIERHEHTSEVMIYYLDAFIVISKSITEFLGKQRGNNLKEWYDEITPKFPLLDHFKDKRDLVIHEGYLDLSSKTEIKYTEHITVVPSITIDFYKVDEDGNRIEEKSSSTDIDYVNESHEKGDKIIINKDSESIQLETLKHENIPSEISAKRYYYFEDFPDKPFIELCKQYFQELIEINRIYGSDYANLV